MTAPMISAAPGHFDALVTAREHDPFAVLGLRREARGWRLVVFRPFAEQVSVRTAAEIAELYPERSYTKLTDQTPRNAVELARRIAEAAGAGYAISHGAVEPGGSSIAAPVRNREGRVVAAIDISAPDSAFDLSKFESRDVPVEPEGDHVVVDRREALRALGVAGAHFMQQARRMGDVCGDGHGMFGSGPGWVRRRVRTLRRTAKMTVHVLEV